jgi:hypothetical protein
MNILCDGDWEKPEIELSDSLSGLIKLGNVLLDVNDEVEILSKGERSPFYAENLDSLILRKLSNMEYDDTIHITISGKKLALEGSSEALSRLGRSLLNFFNANSQEGKHLHLNYYPGNGILAPTKSELIIILKSQ